MRVTRSFGSWALALGCVLACRSSARSDIDAGPAEIAAGTVGPPKAPPPLRTPHRASPPLPDLPPLAEHEKPFALPSGLTFGLGLGPQPCGAVWTGEEYVPLECVDPSAASSVPVHAAEPLVSYRQLAAQPATLPAIVDHRADNAEGPVRNQSILPGCTAFATATAIDHALARWSGKAAHVAVMQLWSRYRTPSERSALEANVGQRVGAEEDWPFNAREANGWMTCPLAGKRPPSGCGLGVDAARAGKVDAHAIAEITQAEYLRPPDVAVMKAKLAAGQDLVLSMYLPATFVPRGRSGAQYIPHDDKVVKKGNVGHALVVAGYASLPHGTYFLLHNSWSERWGDRGYAWIHEASVRAWAYEAIVLDAEPIDRDARGRPTRARGETTCAGDLVPDSIRGTCAPKCADASPRHDGVCPVAGQCQSGYVNLWGACVLAAPAVAGQDVSTGIAWSCGPGGCSYVVPKTSDPACTGGVCRMSCPAPDFRLAKVGGALTCIE